MDQMKEFKLKLAMLDNMLGRLKSSHNRVKELKKNVHVLKQLLKDEKGIRSPYGPKTAIVRFSVQ